MYILVIFFEKNNYLPRYFILLVKILYWRQKIHLQQYGGKLSEDFEEFVDLINKFATLNDWSEQYHMIFYLEGAALGSLQNFLKNKNWEEIVNYLKSRFLQRKILDCSIELQNLKLDINNLMENYIHKIEKYCTPSAQ